MDSASALPVPNPAVIFRSLAEGGVIFSTVDEVYFGLNAVGARVWELLPPATRTFGELIDKLADEYSDVAADVIRADVGELLGELEGHGLIVRPTGAAAGAHSSAQASLGGS